MDTFTLTSAGLARVMELEGYRPGGAPTGFAAGIDADVCAEGKCDRCGHHGLDYRPFTDGRTYRAFAICPQCGYTEEF